MMVKIVSKNISQLIFYRFLKTIFKEHMLLKSVIFKENGALKIRECDHKVTKVSKLNTKELTIFKRKKTQKSLLS